MSVFLTGFSVSMGLIVAIGAQNAWVLGMSVRRIHPWSIAIVCFSIDATLMAIGVAFFGQIQKVLPSVVPFLSMIGIAILLWLAISAALKAIKGTGGLAADESSSNLTQIGAISAAMAMSLLNPHVYLDTVVLVGSLASTSVSPWLFWIGGASASVLWFSALAAIGSPLSRWLSSPFRWRVFYGVIATTMSASAYGLFITI
jgi:L-lysine exporter family protein LysE/ArgO